MGIANNIPLLLSKLIGLMDWIVQYEADHENDEALEGGGGFNSAIDDFDDDEYSFGDGDYEEVAGEEEDEEFVENDDIVDKEGDEYIKMLYEMEKQEKEKKKAEAQNSVKFSGGKILDDPNNLYANIMDDWFDDEDDDMECTSALDGVDDIVYVATSIDNAFARSGETLRGLISTFEASSSISEGEIIMKCNAVTQVARERLEKAN